MTGRVVLMALTIVFAAANGMLDWSMRQSLRVAGPSPASRTRMSFRLDGSFTAKERALILEAFGEIGRASGCVELSVSPARIGNGEVLSWYGDAYATIYKSSNPLTWKHHVARYLTGPGLYMGISIIGTGDMFIMADGDDGHDFRNAIAHEALHVILQSEWHSTHPGSLMYRSIGGGGQRLLAEETAMLRALCVPQTGKAACHGVAH